jgi:hypothetical protein
MYAQKIYTRGPEDRSEPTASIQKLSRAMQGENQIHNVEECLVISNRVLEIPPVKAAIPSYARGIKPEIPLEYVSDRYRIRKMRRMRA